jgi:hypothetical protein
LTSSMNSKKSAVDVLPPMTGLNSADDTCTHPHTPTSGPQIAPYRVSRCGIRHRDFDIGRTLFVHYKPLYTPQQRTLVCWSVDMFRVPR